MNNQRPSYQEQREQQEQRALTVVEPPRMPLPDLARDIYKYDERKWVALVDAVFPSAKTVGGVMLALDYCKARNLDPFKRPVHVVPMWNSKLGREVETVWPGIGELRTTAARTGLWAGTDETQFGRVMRAAFKEKRTTPGRGNNQPRVTEADCPEMEFPEWAQVTVYRMVAGQRVPFTGPKVYFVETFSGEKGLRVPNARWRQAPRQMLGKCFTPDTEVLTTDGFVRFDQLHKTRFAAKVLQVGASGLEVTDSNPFVQDHDGEMIVSDGKALNFMVTPNHDMVTDRGKIEAGDLLDRSSTRANYRIPLTVSASKPDLEGITDAQIILAAALLTDGSVKRGAGTFNISVSRPRKVSKLASLRLHIDRTVRLCAGDKAVGRSGRTVVTRHDRHGFVFDRRDVSRLVDGKSAMHDRILSLSARQARVFVDHLLFFDGHRSKTASRFYASDLQLIRTLELAATVAGYSVSARRERFSDLSDRPNYSVTVSKKASAPVFAEGPTMRGVRRVAHNPFGKVWCVTVPSGVIVVRRNGLAMLCGNCAEAAALRMAFPEELGEQFAADEMEGKVTDQVPHGDFDEADAGDERGGGAQLQPEPSDDDDQTTSETSVEWNDEDLQNFMDVMRQAITQVKTVKALERGLQQEEHTIGTLPAAERAKIEEWTADARERLAPKPEPEAKVAAEEPASAQREPEQQQSSEFGSATEESGSDDTEEDPFIVDFRKRVGRVEMIVDLNTFENATMDEVDAQTSFVSNVCRRILQNRRDELKKS